MPSQGSLNGRGVRLAQIPDHNIRAQIGEGLRADRIARQDAD